MKKTNVLISKDVLNGKARLSFKLGKKVVAQEWLLNSLKANDVLSTFNYEMHPLSGTKFTLFGGRAEDQLKKKFENEGSSFVPLDQIHNEDRQGMLLVFTYTKDEDLLKMIHQFYEKVENGKEILHSNIVPLKQDFLSDYIHSPETTFESLSIKIDLLLNKEPELVQNQD